MVSSRLTGVRKNGRNGDQIANSVRGADSSELTSVKVNNEVAFCRVGNLKQKEEKYTYTNSIDALKETYNEGYRLFEVDISIGKC